MDLTEARNELSDNLSRPFSDEDISFEIQRFSRIKFLKDVYEKSNF